jgi:replicative superfamily II helicase
LFEIALNRNWGPTASVLLQINKSIDKRMWTFQHPLRQMGLPVDIMNKIENRTHEVSVEEMRDMDPNELGQLVHHQRMGMTIAKCVDQFPMLSLDARIAPITRNVLHVELTITPDFVWNDRVHGSVEPWYIWAEDSENVEIYYSEYFLLYKKQFGEPIKIIFTVPLVEPLPSQIYIRAVSDRWLGAETILPVSFQHLILPQLYPPHTDLLDLQPLPISALQNEALEGICAKRFTHFNPVQTQIFHTLYNTDHNALVGAPTGSGKTVAAELVMWQAFRDRPGSKVVYIAPMKALVKERVADWNKRLTGPMKKKLVELTGDVTPDLKTIEAADIIITTPEKWDGISRSWQSRSYVRHVSCVIIDEIHLLGGDRGPILEVIVSRMNYIGSQLDQKVRIAGLSTALANAIDLADWLGIDKVGLFNFRHSVRPVPLEIYIDGFPGKHYCPRMATMNKPTYAAIKTHSPTQPVIVFVSSRRQTRLTAQDLIAYCGMEDNPRQWLHMDDMEMEMLLENVHDESLRMSLAFGIGLHHAGLKESDRKVVEELYLNMKIQILIATSTLAWGVNLPAHLVVIKGTEFYNYKEGRYVDFPITDILQMMGRAGRPQFDNTGISRVFVQDSKKNFFKKFLHEPFPVESSLHKFLDDHINAEIVGGTIKTKQDALDYLTWTYFYRRLQQNPTFYGLDDMTQKGVDKFLSNTISDVASRLEKSGCVEIVDDFELVPLISARIASYYYLHHNTVRHFNDSLQKDSAFDDVLDILSNVPEYEELPARCNEDLLNQEIEKCVPYDVKGMRDFKTPFVKAYVLVQAHISRLELPISDYITDQITVLDSAIRFSQAMIDVSADHGYLTTSLTIMNMLQCIKQARWLDESTLLTLPHIRPKMLQYIRHKVICFFLLLLSMML